MLKIKLSKRADKFLDTIPNKHARQIAERISTLAQKPDDVQHIELRGYAPWRRAKSGEYRIIFQIEDETLFIGLIGKRNDGDIYRLIERFLR